MTAFLIYFNYFVFIPKLDSLLADQGIHCLIKANIYFIGTSNKELFTQVSTYNLIIYETHIILFRS